MKPDPTAILHHRTITETLGLIQLNENSEQHHKIHSVIIKYREVLFDTQVPMTNVKDILA